ncbi:AntA/AntB antirepressor [compost metagenome]
MEYGFAENIDFITVAQKRATAQGNETTFTDHHMKIEMAKEICMIQQNEKSNYL